MPNSMSAETKLKFQTFQFWQFFSKVNDKNKWSRKHLMKGKRKFRQNQTHCFIIKIRHTALKKQYWLRPVLRLLLVDFGGTTSFVRPSIVRLNFFRPHLPRPTYTFPDQFIGKKGSPNWTFPDHKQSWIFWMSQDLNKGKAQAHTPIFKFKSSLK